MTPWVLWAAMVAAGPPMAQAPAAASSTASERVAPAELQPPLEQVTFEEAVRRALDRSTVALVAAEEVRRADGLLWQARSGSLPLLVAGAALTHLDDARRSSSGISSAQDQRSASLTLSVPVFAPSRWYQWAHGSQALEAALASEQDLRRTAAITTGRAYLTIVAQRRTLAVVTRARDNARAHYDFAHARRTAGTGNALDELRAEQQMATTQAQLEQTYAALAQAREALGILTGGNAPLDAAAEPELPAAAEPERAIQEAEQRRPDVRAGQARAYAAERLAADSWSDWLPTILATGVGFHQNPPTTSNPQTGWQVQLVLSWPLFEGGLRTGQARERGALANQAGAQLDLLLRQARSDVRLAWETMLRAESAYRESRRAADRAASVLQLATQAYKAGALNSLDVIDAERQARDVETTAIVAEDAVRQSRLSLLAATGRFP
jgi:outer membrane protein